MTRRPDVSVRTTIKEAALMSKVQRAFLMVAGVVGVGAVPMNSAVGASSVLGSSVCAHLGPLVSGIEYTTSGVKNNTGSAQTFVCSLFRDNTSNTNGMQDLEISLLDPVGGTICTAYSFDRKGVEKKRASKTSGVVGDVVIDFGAAINVSTVKGFYSVVCQIPDQALLRSIYYVEP